MDRTKSRGAMWGLLALVVAIGLMGSALAADPALAGKPATNGHGGNGGNGGNGGTPTLAVSPSPVPAGTAITISGSGLKANAAHLVGVLGYVPWDQVTTDSTGAFSFTFTRTADPTVFPPGTYYVQAKQSTNKGMVTVASTSFTVVP